jgi:hypothetical protein
MSFRSRREAMKNGGSFVYTQLFQKIDFQFLISTVKNYPRWRKMFDEKSAVADCLLVKT